MVTSDDRRSAMLDLLTDYVLAEGLAAASLRPLAHAAGLSDRMLLYYFKDKAAVIAAVLERISARLVALLGDRTGKRRLPIAALRREITAIVLADDLWPYMRVWLEVASRAGHGDPFYRATGEQIARGFLAWGAAQLDSPTPEQRDADAATLLVTIEGMVLLKSVGLDDVCRAAL